CRRSGLDCPRAQSSNPLGYAGSRTLGVCAPITYRLTGNSDCGAVGMVCYRPNAYPSRQNHHSDCAPPSNFTLKLFTVTFSTAESGLKINCRQIRLKNGEQCGCSYDCNLPSDKSKKG